MKEVHQALISLGPLIATTVFSLRAKEKEVLFLTDNQYSESQQNISHSPRDTFPSSDILFRIEHQEPPHLNSPLYSKVREENICLREGVPCPNTDILSREKKEPVSIFIDHLGAEMKERSTDSISEYEVVSLRIKDEKETYCMENEESQRLEISSPTGGEIMNRKKKVGGSMKRNERTPQCKPFSGKTKTMITSTGMKEVNSRNQNWSETNQEQRGENSSQCESNVSQPVRVSLHQGSHSIGILNTYVECKNPVRNLPIPTDIPNTQQHQIPYICNKSSRKNYLKGERTRNVRTNARARPYACTECDKSFFQKTHLIIHHRIHSGEKPYMCIFCHKRFNRKDYLNEHVRIHTGERPYKCSKCEKSFIQKSHLNEHQRKHT